MSSSDRMRANAPPVRSDATPATVSPVPPTTTDAYPSWLDRVQRARARHAAITKNLYTWSNYKNWAERMKHSWEEDKAPETPRPPTR